MPMERSTLKRYYPDGTFLKETNQHIIWECDITPTPLSQTYRIRIDYKANNRPDVYVVRPQQLPRYDGLNHLEHVYNTKTQKLCLYHPNFDKWNYSKPLVKTIIPWAAEWLMYYEIWLVTGEWEGGGIHPNKGENKE